MRILLERAEKLGGTLLLDDICKRIYIIVPINKDISWIWEDHPYPPEKGSGHKVGRSALWKKDA